MLEWRLRLPPSNRIAFVIRGQGAERVFCPHPGSPFRGTD
jgi:hypothetical protein